MKKRIKCFALILVFILGASLTGCGNSAAPAPSAAPAGNTANDSDDTIRIGYSIQGMTPYGISVVKALEENVKRYNDQGIKVELSVLDGENDPAKQITHCENFVQQGVDVILLNPISFDGCVPGVEAAVAADVPVVTLITEVANQEKCAAFVGSRHYDSGVMIAEAAIRDNGEKFSYVVIEGVMGIDAQIQRLKGINDVLAKYPDTTRIEIQSASWERPDAMRLVENWIQAGKKFDVILSENDNMALGAIEALKAANLADKVKVYGVDGDNDAIKVIKEGDYAGTALQSAMNQATYAIDACVALAQGHPEKVEKSVIVPFEWIDQSNVDEYMK